MIYLVCENSIPGDAKNHDRGKKPSGDRWGDVGLENYKGQRASTYEEEKSVESRRWEGMTIYKKLGGRNYPPQLKKRTLYHQAYSGKTSEGLGRRYASQNTEGIIGFDRQIEGEGKGEQGAQGGQCQASDSKG